EVYTEKNTDDVLGDLVSKFDPKARRGFNLTFSSNTSGYNSQSNTRHLFFGLDNATAGKWVDCGRPGGLCKSSDALTVFDGGKNGGVYVYEGGKKWTQCGDFGRPHTSGVHNGRLYAAYPQGEVFAFDGNDWEHLGNPLGSLKDCNQLHAQGAYQGEWFVGTWP